jgi:hypothetical protein
VCFAVPVQLLMRGAADERARGCLVLGLLVNAFTNYCNVKGEQGQNKVHVMEVTHALSVLRTYSLPCLYNSA